MDLNPAELLYQNSVLDKLRSWKPRPPVFTLVGPDRPVGIEYAVRRVDTTEQQLPLPGVWRYTGEVREGAGAISGELVAVEERETGEVLIFRPLGDGLEDIRYEVSTNLIQEGTVLLRPMPRSELFAEDPV